VWRQDINPPSPGTTFNFLHSVAAITSNDIWAVGYYDSNTLTEHWDGTSWTVYTNPNTGYQQQLYSVSPILSTYVWAVGFITPTYGGTPVTLTLKWDGTSWTTVTSPNKGTLDNYLRGVAVVPGTSPAAGGDIWTSGFSYINTLNNAQTLVEQYTIPAGTRNP